MPEVARITTESEDRGEMIALTRSLLDAVADIRRWLAGPPAPDEQVRSWRLFSGQEYGGVYCAQPDCGCEGHNSELIAGAWPAEDANDEADTFTIDDLHAATAAHIAGRAQRRTEVAGA